MGIVWGHSLIHRSVAKKQVPAGPEMSLSLCVHFPHTRLEARWNGLSCKEDPSSPACYSSMLC